MTGFPDFATELFPQQYNASNNNQLAAKMQAL
jgi:hypothetical protein